MGVYGLVGQPKASKPEVRVRHQEVLVFFLCLSRKKCYYLYFIVLGPSQLMITCISLRLLDSAPWGTFISDICRVLIYIYIYIYLYIYIL